MKNWSLIILLYSLLTFQAKAKDPEASIFIEFLKNLAPATIYFTQSNTKENFVNGWFALGNNGQARVEYEPPNDFVLVSDGEWLIFHEPHSFQTTHFPIENGPFRALLNPSSIFDEDSNLYLISFKENDNKTYLKLSMEENKDTYIPGSITLIFQTNPINLLGWSIIDSQANITNVSILSIEPGSQHKDRYGDDVFKLTEAVRNQGNIYRGPWEREPVAPPLSHRGN